MSEKEQQILATLSTVLPKLTDNEKDRLLAFGEGIAWKAEDQKKKESDKKEPGEPPDSC